MKDPPKNKIVFYPPGLGTVQVISEQFLTAGFRLPVTVRGTVESCMRTGGLLLDMAVSICVPYLKYSVGSAAYTAAQVTKSCFQVFSFGA